MATYYGSTELSSVANPPRLMAGGALYGAVGTSVLSTAKDGTQQSAGGQLWFYASTDATTGITASGFFDDGAKLGMRPGDLLMHVSHVGAAGSTVSFSMHVVATVNSTAGTASLQSTANAAYYLSSTRASSI